MHQVGFIYEITELFLFLNQNKSFDENGNAVHQNYRLESANSNDRKSKQRRMKVCPLKTDTAMKLTLWSVCNLFCMLQ